MKILVVVATPQEISLTLDYFKLGNTKKGNLFELNDKISFLITGVGMVATAYSLGKELGKQNFDVAINIGIAGSFNRSISLGDIVKVEEDIIADLGAQDKDDFLSLEDMGFATSSDFRFRSDTEYLQQLKHLKTVKAITVNTVHGNMTSIEKVVNRLAPDIESMEGAAFHYACQDMGIKAVQIRSISNYVEERDKQNWNIPLAIKNLNNELIKFVESLI